MNALSEIKSHFSAALAKLVDDPTQALGMIRPAGDPKFGDYQANCAMSLGKQLGKPPRDIATDLVAGVSLDSLCSNVEICLLYTSPSPRDGLLSRMPSSA